MSLLKVENLKVHFPVSRGGWLFGSKQVVHAVDGVSFEMKEAETLGLVGESGCGKSTTGRSVLRLLDVTSGEIQFSGTPITHLSSRALHGFRRQAQMVFQNPYSSLDPRMTIGEIVAEPLKSLTNMLSAERLRRMREVLDEVQLNQKFINRYPHEFSGGQRQRINIARAIAVMPRLIIADEPVSALDVSIQAQIINLLQDLQRKYRMAFLFIAHDLSVVKTLSHRVAVMYLGRIVELGETAELYANPKHPYTQALLSAVPIPDPVKERKRSRIKLTGEIPSPIHKPKGCSFHPRCPIAVERCRQETPELRVLKNGSQAACHLAE